MAKIKTRKKHPVVSVRKVLGKEIYYVFMDDKNTHITYRSRAAANKQARKLRRWYTEGK